jgi:hypothetical protein
VSCILTYEGSLLGWYLSTSQDPGLGWASWGWVGGGNGGGGRGGPGGQGLPVNDRVCMCVAGNAENGVIQILCVCIQGVCSGFHVLAVMCAERYVTGSHVCRV